ncbi:MAG TPA: hypothetical protein VGL92_01775 [Acidimicrobiia bacterium]
MPFAFLVLLPPPGAGGAPEEAAAQEAVESGFHGFGSFETRAQGQVAELTGFLNAFREDNRIVGAVSEINGPPANSRNIAAFFQRGEGATFIYGVIGGGGGERGTLPDPPPGEANAFYPTDPPESTFAGPVASGTNQVPDGRFHAKATETPTGRADAAVIKLVSEGLFTVEASTVVSHTEPVNGGVRAESVSVLQQVTAGPLLIQTLVSRAMAFVPAAGGEPTGIASTVVEGATVGGQPVQITDKGVLVGENANPLNQEQVNKAFADAGFEQVRLLPSTAKSSDGGQAVLADAGVLEFVKQDEAFGASNPQGFSGGGFSLGGATAGITSVRCAPDCPEGLGVPEDPVGEGDIPPLEGASPGSDGADSADGSDLSYASGESFTPVDDGSSSGTGGGSAALDIGGLSGGANLSLPTGPSLDYSSSTAVTPPDLNTATGGSYQQAAPAPVVSQQAALAASGLGPKEADWVRDLYLGLGVATGVLFVGSRLAQAFK